MEFYLMSPNWATPDKGSLKLAACVHPFFLATDKRPSAKNIAVSRIFRVCFHRLFEEKETCRGAMESNKSPAMKKSCAVDVNNDEDGKMSPDREDPEREQYALCDGCMRYSDRCRGFFFVVPCILGGIVLLIIGPM